MLSDHPSNKFYNQRSIVVKLNKVIEFDIQSARCKNYAVKLKKWNSLITKGENGISIYDRSFDVAGEKSFNRYQRSVCEVFKTI